MTIPAPLPQHDPIADALADAIIQRINLDHLAARIAAHISHTPPPLMGGQAGADTPYPINAIRKELGNRRTGRPMAYQTFKKHFLDNHRLTLIQHPTDRRSQYVSLGQWLKIKKEIQK